MMAWLSQLMESAAASPWVYLAIFGLVVADAVLILLPSETLIISATVFAINTGTPLLWLVALAAALGAFAGDHLAYGLGKWSMSRRLGDGKLPGVRRALNERGSQLIVSARFVPGGRTMVTTACGALGFPLQRFSVATAIGAFLWTTDSILLGFLGQAASADNPLFGVFLGLGLAASVTVVVELVRLARRRHAKRATKNELQGEMLPHVVDGSVDQVVLAEPRTSD